MFINSEINNTQFTYLCLFLKSLGIVNSDAYHLPHVINVLQNSLLEIGFGFDSLKEAKNVYICW